MEEPKTRVRPENWNANRPNEGDNEQWKNSPTTETTGAQGSNARVDRERAGQDNVPPVPKPDRDPDASDPPRPVSSDVPESERRAKPARRRAGKAV